MKWIVSALILALSFSLTACDESASADKHGSDSVVTKSENNAGQTIEFHNKLLDFLNAACDPLKSVAGKMEDSVEYSERQGNIKPLWQTVFVSHSKNVTDYKGVPPGFFSKEDQTMFNNGIKAVKDSYAELMKIVADMKAYFQAEDYKDDNFKKVHDLSPRVDELINTIYAARGQMLSRSNDLATIAERELLKDDPEAIYLFNMQDILAKAEEQTDCFMDDAFEDIFNGLSDRLDENGELNPKRAEELKMQRLDHAKPIVQKIDELTMEMDAMAEKHKAMDKKALSPALVREYDDFYKDYDTYKGEIRKLRRRLTEIGLVDYDQVERAYKSLITSYNSYVNTSNRQ